MLLPFSRQPPVDLFRTEIINAAVKLHGFPCVWLGSEVSPEIVLFDLERFHVCKLALLFVLDSLRSAQLDVIAVIDLLLFPEDGKHEILEVGGGFLQLLQRTTA